MDTVLDLLLDRIGREHAGSASTDFEAIPFQIENGPKGMAEHHLTEDHLVHHDSWSLDGFMTRLSDFGMRTYEGLYNENWRRYRKGFGDEYDVYRWDRYRL